MLEQISRFFRIAFYALSRRRIENFYTYTPFLDELCCRENLLAEFGESSPEGMLLRARPMLAQHYLNTLGEVEALRAVRNLEPWRPSVPLLATMHLTQVIGRELRDEAARVLPSELDRIGREFHSVDASAQRALLREVQGILSSKGTVRDPWTHSSRKFRLDDSENQPLSRIVPRRYGRWLGEGNPNCFGKAQLLWAFGEKYRIRSLGVAPIQTAHSYAQKLMQGAARDLFQRSVENHVALQLGLIRTFLRYFENEAVEEELCESPHFGAVFQLKDGSWSLVDPHMNISGQLASSRWEKEMRRVDDQLSRYGQIVPGLSLLASDADSPRVAFDDVRKRTMSTASAADTLVSAWRNRETLPLRTALSLFVISRAVELLKEAPDFFAPKDRWKLDAALRGSDSLHLGVIWADPRYPDQRLPREVEQRVSVAMIVLDQLSGAKSSWRCRGRSWQIALRICWKRRC